jgi:hypothetical protein
MLKRNIRLIRGVYPPEAMEQTSPVKKSDDLFPPCLWFLTSFLARMLHLYSPIPSLLLLLTGVRWLQPRKNFEIMFACRRVSAQIYFGRKNPVFDEPTKSSPLLRLKVCPYFFHVAFAPDFTLCRRPLGL